MTNLNFESGWEAKVESDETGRWQRLTWRLSGHGLAQVLAGHGQAGAEAARWPGLPGVLLLSDVHVLDDGLLATNVLARAEPGGEGLRLEVLVTTERGAALELVCRLTTNARAHAVPLTGAAAIFSHVRPAEIEGGLTISLERSGSAAKGSPPGSGAN